MTALAEEDKSVIFSVSEALRLLPSIDDMLANTRPSAIKVSGVISSVRPLCKMIKECYWRCPQCGAVSPSAATYDKPEFFLKSLEGRVFCGEQTIAHKTESKVLMEPVPEYVNAVVIELQDDDKFNDLEKLYGILFGNDTIDILLGERVVITGSIHIIQNGISKKNSKFYPCLFSEAIVYESKDEIILTKLDVEAIKRFTNLKGDNIIDELAKMFAPQVIGYNHVKKGSLLSAASSGNDLSVGRVKKPRRRMHTLLVGDPGLAKTIFLKEITKLVYKSRYESGQSSSTKSLTAIVEKEDGEGCILRTGPIPLAKEAICSINEIGHIPYDEQAHLLDSMEEGEFTINKHGVNAKVRAQTVIVASANPKSGSQWNNKEKINLDEIPVIKPLLDRFDLIFPFKTSRDEKVIREYTLEKSKFDDCLVPDYTFYLTKHIMYAKQVAPNPKISEEASVMLNEFYIEIAKTTGSPRVRETVFNIARMFARLRLRNEVTADDAREACQFYEVMLREYSQIVIIPQNPMDTTCNVCLHLLESRYSNNGIVFEELIKEAKTKSEHVLQYIGNKYKLRNNMIMRKVLERLLNDSHLILIKQKPTVLQWITGCPSSSVPQDVATYGACDTCDSCDKPNTPHNLSGSQNIENEYQKNEILSTVNIDSANGDVNDAEAEAEVPETFPLSHISHVSHSRLAEMAEAYESGNGVNDSEW